MTATTPRWKTIAADLEKRLAGGEFDDGFPGEHALAHMYGVSRGTIRQALRPLRETGLVTGERGRKPRIIDSARGTAYGPLHSIFAAVEAADRSQVSRVLTQDVTVYAAAAAALNLPADTPLFHLSRVRLADGEPLGRDSVWLPYSQVAALTDVDFTATALYRELRDRCGIVLDGGREEVGTAAADAQDMTLLGCHPGEPLLRIRRIGYHQGHPVEVRHSRIRGTRYQLTIRFGTTPDRLPDPR